jgi:hypothetical protein
MRPSRIFLFLVLLFSFAHSFNPSDYLYSGESPSSINEENFTLDGTKYSIIQISGKKTFLTKNNAPIEDKSNIEKIIFDYYLETYYPSKSEFQNIYDLIDSYDKSRNDGELKPYPGKEEYTCREIVFADGRVKSGKQPVTCKPDLDNCNFSAMFFYSYLSAQSTPPFGSWTDLVKPIKDFAFPSYKTDYIISNMTYKLNNSDNTQMYDAIKYIKDSVPELKTHKKGIEETSFGRLWKESTQSWVYDPKYWGYCPPLRLNGTYLDSLESDADSLLTKMAPFDQYEAVASSISTNTAARLKYYSDEVNVTHYSSLYDPLAKEASKVIDFCSIASIKVSNSTLQSDFSHQEQGLLIN